MSADGRPGHDPWEDPWEDPPEPPEVQFDRWLNAPVSDEADQGQTEEPGRPRHNHSLPPPPVLPDAIAYVAGVLAAEIGGPRGLRHEFEQLEAVVAAASMWRPKIGGRRLRPGQVCDLVRGHTAWGRRGDRTLCAVVDRHLSTLQERDPTELGLALRVMDQHGPDVAWVPGLDRWHVWHGTRWRPDDGGARVWHLVTEIVELLGPGEAEGWRRMAEQDAAQLAALHDSVDEATVNAAKTAAETSARRAKAATAFSLRAQGAQFVTNTLKHLRARQGVIVDADAWDARADLLATPDGVVELDVDRGAQPPRAPRREDRITLVTRAGAAAWAAGVVADGGAWERFVREAFPDPEVRRYVRRLLGYSLLGDNRERIIVILTGGTSTGKSTLIGVISTVLGGYARTFELTLMRGKAEEGPRADLVKALPARFLYTTEASDRWKLHADAIKRLTGGDVVQARTLHSREHVERRPAFTPWVATNGAPTVVGVDEALWRRLVVVPMGQRVRAEDPKLGERLCADADAVLAWLLDGFSDYAQHGLGEPPEACAAAAETLRDDLSLVDAWLSEDTVREPDAEALPGDLAAAWQAWCRANHVADGDRLSDVQLGRELHARGYGWAKRGPRAARERVRRGLRLREPERQALHVVES